MTYQTSASPIDIPRSGPRAIGYWLLGCCFMVIAMMLIGAVTRLTESGLSMVEWRPLIGALPPLSDAEWHRVFALYKETSEYQLANAGMSLEQFKQIFWWEYIHRVWGRLIGIVFAVPFLWFLVRKQVPKGLTPHLLALFLLGGLQGVIGWWMVKSGFVDRTDVSQYRLSIHLIMAFAILGYMLWIALAILAPVQGPRAPALARRIGWAALAILFVTLGSGGLVAGLDAGLVYNEWPTMGDGFVPVEFAELEPFWLNLFDNPGTVQFDHRTLAYVTAATVIVLWFAVRRGHTSSQARRATNWAVFVVLLQIGLGIATVLGAVPIALAVAHQAGAIALFCVTVWATAALAASRSPAQSGL